MTLYMKMFKNVTVIFFSLKTAIILLFALLCLLLYGSLAMPLNQEFQLLSVVPLLRWMIESPLPLTWWLWASVCILLFLTVNTLFCSFESLIMKRESKNWLLKISPQIIHAGFLFILLAHLMSSYGSFKGTTFVTKGSMLRLPNGLAVLFDSVNAVVDPSGYLRDWSAEVRYFEDGRQITSDVIQPNNPSFEKGLGIYIKTVRLDPYPVALIEVSREPGAVWALVGGILFLIGTVSLLILKVRREEAADS
jgi:hypothetical protein